MSNPHGRINVEWVELLKDKAHFTRGLDRQTFVSLVYLEPDECQALWEKVRRSPIHPNGLEHPFWLLVALHFLKCYQRNAQRVYFGE
jgi:hypothetical protein